MKKSYVLLRAGRVGKGAATMRELINFALPFPGATEDYTFPRRMFNEVYWSQCCGSKMFIPNPGS
jgi:hypothetical protein